MIIAISFSFVFTGTTPDLPAYDISFLLQSIGCKDGRSYSAPSLPFKWRQIIHGRPLQGTAPPMCAYKIKNLESAQHKTTWLTIQNSTIAKSIFEYQTKNIKLIANKYNLRRTFGAVIPWRVNYSLLLMVVFYYNFGGVSTK